ncbi:hypothetical protein DFH29DRAFT_1010674 [Suillus ampliporus]|nr:hypothetical protein DFH29DRAFT_1010674 [Suillus ampliporus]
MSQFGIRLPPRSPHICNRASFCLKPPPPPNLIFGNASNDIPQTRLQFLVPGNNKVDGSRLMKLADVPGQLLTINYLCSVASKIENPINANLLLFLCPTIGNISGNLPLQLALPRGRHYCLARRVMDRFGTSDLRELSEEPGCITSYPQASSFGGPDTKITAQGLIAWTQAWMAGKVPCLPHNITISDFNHQNIFSPDILFNVGAGVSPGVMHTVLECALTDMCEDAKLCRRQDGRTGYLDLNTNSIICTPHRQADNEAFGFLAAAHLFLTGHGPHPLSPAVIIFCIAGYDGLFDLELMGLLLPDYVGVLKKWPLIVPATTEIFIKSDITTLGINHLDASPSEILDTASNDGWHSLTEAFYSAILFGDMGTASSSAMTNFKRGFNICVSITQGLCDTLRDCYKSILSACYGRMIQSPTCVISKIAFRSTSSDI